MSILEDLLTFDAEPGLEADNSMTDGLLNTDHQRLNAAELEEDRL